MGSDSAGAEAGHRRSARQPGPDSDVLLLPNLGDNLRWYGITWGAVEFHSHHGPALVNNSTIMALDPSGELHGPAGAHPATVEDYHR